MRGLHSQLTIHEFVTRESIRPRVVASNHQTGEGSGEFPIQRQIALGRGAPAEILVHRATLRGFPLGAAVIERKRAADRRRKALRLESFEYEARSEVVGEIFERRVRD